MVLIAAIVLFVGVLAFLVWFDDEAERYTAGTPPGQFRRELDADLLDDYAGVFGVAHNSGDDLDATKEALDHGADIIEVDVVAFGGRLYASHDLPLRGIGGAFFRGPPLDDVWRVASQADAVKLDLKESGSSYVDAVIAFLDQRRDDDVEAIAVTSDLSALDRLRREAPHVVRLFSAASRSDVERLRTDGELRGLVDGVSIRHDHLDDETARWLEDNRLLVGAWVVNDAPTMNRLVALGVDALTTDNLAIMELLGEQERDEQRFAARIRERVTP
jgi:hypothetical protein